MKPILIRIHHDEPSRERQISSKFGLHFNKTNLNFKEFLIAELIYTLLPVMLHIIVLLVMLHIIQCCQ